MCIHMLLVDTCSSINMHSHSHIYIYTHAYTYTGLNPLAAEVGLQLPQLLVLGATRAHKIAFYLNLVFNQSFLV